MTRLKIFGVMVGALFALAVMSASASAISLPDIHTALPGEKYPVVAEGKNGGATKLGSASGVTLEGVGVTLTQEVKELTSLGPFKAVFTEVKAPGGEKCETAGAGVGVVNTLGTYHMIYTSKSPLTLGILFLPENISIKCGGSLTIAVRGDVIASISKIGTEESELTEFGGVLTGANGKQSLSEFYNDGGTIVKARLESNAGAGFVGADENVANETVLSVLGSKMIKILLR